MEEKLISAAIITKNEGKNLKDCLKSIKFVDQVVIIDSGSTDDTVDIAQQFGCDFYPEPWKGFGPQKQSAIDKCKFKWVLVIDADERIPTETARTIQDAVRAQSDIAGYRFPRKNYFQGRWIRHLGWWPDKIVRLFKRDMGKMSDDEVHEEVLVKGKIKDLNCPIEHYTEDRFSKILQKIDQYSSLGAERAYREGKRCSIWEAALRAELSFYQNYFLRLGFLDGHQGFTLSITDAINKFSKYAKLSQMSKRSDD